MLTKALRHLAINFSQFPKSYNMGSALFCWMGPAPKASSSQVLGPFLI
jgi:hypothetical protein